MPRIARIFFALVVLAGMAVGARAEVSGADQQAIQSLITNQLEAFKRDDGTTAYSYASPNIRGLYPTPTLFMDMVRNGYPPVYRPGSVTFGPIIETPNGPLQKVFLTGPDGKGYVAVYSLQRQPDGTWLINGCMLVLADGPTI